MRQKSAGDSYVSNIYDINMSLVFSVDGIEASDILNNTFFTTNVTFTKKYFIDTKNSTTTINKIDKQIKLRNCSFIKENSDISKFNILFIL